VVTTTEYGSIYRGVSIDPAPAPVRPKGSDPMANECSETSEGWSTSVPLSPGLAHVYTECARIWNPIHTDRAVAIDAGLPDIILHGTATLALAVSQVLRREPAEAARRVRRIACRFTGMVRLPSTITVRALGETTGRASRVIAFQVLTENGRPAVSKGFIEIGD